MKRAPVIFGSADGLTLVLSLVAGMVVSHQSRGAVWHAALSGGLAELAGMSLGQYWSAKEDGFPAALSCGVAGCLSVLLPGLPFVLAPSALAVPMALALVLVSAGFVAWLRPEHGWEAVGETFGLLLVAAALTTGAGAL